MDECSHFRSVLARFAMQTQIREHRLGELKCRKILDLRPNFSLGRGRLNLQADRRDAWVGLRPPLARAALNGCRKHSDEEITEGS